MHTSQDTAAPRRKWVDLTLFSIITLLAALLPIFVIPVPSVASLSKPLLYFIAGIFTAILLVISFLKDGRIAVPKSKSVLAFAALVLVMLLSALVSGHAKYGLIGVLSIDTVAFYAVALLFMYAMPLVLTNKRRVVIVLGSFAFTTVLAGIVHVVRIGIGQQYLTFGVIGNLTTSLVGSWSDLGILIGLVSVLSLAAHEILTASRAVRIGLRVIFVISLLILTVINSLLIWSAVGAAMLLLFVYSFSVTLGKRRTSAEESDSSYRVPLLPLAAVIICVCFVLISLRTNPYTSLGSISKLSFFDRYGLNMIEGRPSFASTYSVGLQTLKAKNVLGVGPNRFSEAWNYYKSVGVNQYPFWGSDFTFGFGTIVSSFVTLGVAGVLAWLAFLFFFISAGVRIAFRRFGDKLSQFLVGAAFLGSLYLWFFMLIYTPGIVVFIAAILFTGILLSLREQTYGNNYSTVNFISDPRVAFGSVLSLVVILIGSVISFYWIASVAVSNAYMLKGAQSLASNNIDQSEREVGNSIRIRPTDTAYRLLASIGLARAQSLAQAGNSETVAAQLRTTIQSTLAIAAAAVAIDNDNYENWVTLGQVYRYVTSPDSADAYGEALKAYDEALKRNPTSPSITLLKAQLELAHGNKEGARSYILESISKKPDYLDAYYLLSQLYADEGNTQDAVNALAAAIEVDPQNALSWFQIGLLYYSTQEYQSALKAFENAVTLNPQFANARYFGGLALEKLGREEDALQVFELLKRMNPGSNELDGIISNLKAGRPAVNQGSQAPTSTSSTSTRATSTSSEE